MKRIPIIFDVDTGIDDATTLMMACVSDSLEILGGTFSESDWHYLRNMVSLQTFIMSDSVEKEKIADMPDVSSGSIFPKTICSVELQCTGVEFNGILL